MRVFPIPSSPIPASTALFRFYSKLRALFAFIQALFDAFSPASFDAYIQAPFEAWRGQHAAIFARQYRPLLLEYRPLLLEYRPLLLEYRPLLLEYRPLLLVYS